MPPLSPGRRLEQYTLQHPQEVLLVHAWVAGQADEILIFRGFSSSLVRPTAFDPDVPVLPEDADIQSIDILVGPYSPAEPQYLQQGLSLAQILSLLDAARI
jgi:hypothetical protein